MGFLMGEPKIPVFVAVGFWFASALAVASYTYVAFKETANGAESGAMLVAAGADPLVATAGILSSELSPQPKGSLRSLLPNVPSNNIQRPFKPLERGKFKGSQ